MNSGTVSRLVPTLVLLLFWGSVNAAADEQLAFTLRLLHQVR
jgi:hypothetical protein